VGGLSSFLRRPCTIILVACLYARQIPAPFTSYLPVRIFDTTRTTLA